MKNQKVHLNPDELIQNPAFSQIVITEGKGRTIYIGGQNSVSGQGEIVGKGDILLQTGQVMENLKIALEACGATFRDLVKLNIYVVPGHDLRGAFQVSQKYLGNLSHPPVITTLFVQGLAHPDFLLEIDGVAFLPENEDQV
jgi:enamine deaminase RidA (YjgF/YER057c/UK114 family)